MPLVLINHVPTKDDIPSDVRIGLWKLTETVSDFYSLFPHLHQYREVLSLRFKSPSRQLEFLAAHALLFLMTHDKSMTIDHLPTGKPILPMFHISVSHTRGYVVLMLSPIRHVAIDIERIDTRVRRIATRFIREDEKAEDTITQLLLWSAKETLYKLHSDDSLGYFDIKTTPFEAQEQGEMQVANLRRATSVGVRYLVASDYVLTFASELRENNSGKGKH